MQIDGASAIAERNKPHIPGMVWTVLAFGPWILYWVLVGLGRTTAGILWGLGGSLAINSYRLIVRKVKILDTVSLVFLAASSLVTIILGSDLVVLYGGVLSDLTLALMAWGSLIAGNPFTYDYAKEDWDEAFWDNPIFVRTNQIITAVWGSIFTLQALFEGAALVMGLEGTARLLLVAIVPRSLLGIGFAFSVWFPRWYPPRAAARQTGQEISKMGDGMTGLQLVESMPLAFNNAQAAGDLRATVQFRLSGDGGGVGYLEIGSGRCVFHDGEAEDPTLVIESPAEVWTAVSRGEKNGAQAFLDGAYRADGDLSVLLQLDKLFSAAPS